MDLYKWKDARGNIHYSDVLPKGETENSITPLNFELPLINRIEHQVDIVPTIQNKAHAISNAKEKISTALLGKADKFYPELLECFSPSPKARGESFAKEPLTKDELKNVRSIFEQLSGIWKGEGEEVLCSGEVNTPEPIYRAWQTDLDVKLRKSKELIFEFSLDDQRKGVSKREYFEFFINDLHLAMSKAQKDETVRMSITESGFTVWMEYFPVNGQHREMLRSVKLNNNQLKVEQYSFANSMLTGSLVWELNRR